MNPFQRDPGGLNDAMAAEPHCGGNYGQKHRG
eukprot:CAMPEP_0204467856 /NCGR_PEP_ID=MMETSP0471-20130131/10125_1 /ASSEMBLY_ACC=CAM_ASM_000602 /TAXON_ID=2969 /ORGANISM="Oxyrrhis marina" /LENGTH=31 /DNA_ID= /DNA_START= /DNA_END= /DNA_ORIENTATION=